MDMHQPLSNSSLISKILGVFFFLIKFQVILKIHCLLLREVTLLSSEYPT